MSVRGIFASTVSVCVIVLLSWPAASAGESVGPESAQKSGQQGLTEADKQKSREKETPANAEQPPRIGVVQQALRHLYTIPRASALQLGGGDSQARAGWQRPASSRPAGNRLGLQHDDAIRNSVSSVPIGGQTEPHRLGLQHDDAIRHSVSSVPIGGVTRGDAGGVHGSANGSGNGTEPVAPGGGGTTNIIIGPSGYYYPRRRLPESERGWTNYRYYGGRPSRYGYGMNDYPYGYGDEGDIYRFGFTRGYDTGRFDKVTTDRQDAALAHASGHLQRGLTLFRQGRYREAAGAFKLAAETNQGDPAARIYAAHALFATGRYRDAVRYLRRAFELQPRIALLDYDLRDDYGKRADFDEQLEELEKALRRFPRNLDRLVVLGYVHRYSNQLERAYEALARASKINPRDRLVARLMENCQPPDVRLDKREPEAGTSEKQQ